jgi:anthranilate synthase component 2
MIRILLIDNFDSFTFNLVHLIAQNEKVIVTVMRNNEDYLSKLDNGNFDGVIVSPGPGSPESPEYFGNCATVIAKYPEKGIPVLGICLGFQGIAVAYGASLKKAEKPMHGKLSKIRITNKTILFESLNEELDVMRYHSLMVDTDKPFPNDLVVNARVIESEVSVSTNGDEIMSIQHRELPLYGIQFHPESFATDSGKQIMINFIDIVRTFKKKH